MRFDLNDEQRAIKDAIRDLCRPLYEKTSASMGTPARSEAFWQKLAASGWTHLCVPAEAGGQGAGLVELSLAVEELGYVLAPASYLGQAAAALVLSGAPSDLDRRRLSDIAAGRSRAGFGEVLAGGARVAIDADGADLLVLLGDRDALVYDPLPEGSERAEGVDITRNYAHITSDGGEPLEGSFELARDRIEVLIAAELVGVAQHAMDLAVEHAKQREQFGRPIGAYEAVSHRCADMLVAVESARSAVLSAAWTADHEPEGLPFAASVAKVTAADAAWQVAASALQVHGGIGFTWEHPIHLFLRRAAASSRLLGSVAQHLERIASLSGLASPDAAPDPRHAAEPELQLAR